MAGPAQGTAPPDTAWYVPGAALPSNVHILCYSGFDLFDFIAVDLKTAEHLFCLPEGEFPQGIMETGVCGCEGCREGDLKMHNRLALTREIALITRFIADQQLREFVEARSRMQAAHVAILRHLDRHYPFIEQRLPVVRSGRLGAMSGEALKRPEVVRFAERVVGRYIPPTCRRCRPPALLCPETLFVIPESPEVFRSGGRTGTRADRDVSARPGSPGA